MKFTNFVLSTVAVSLVSLVSFADEAKKEETTMTHSKWECVDGKGVVVAGATKDTCKDGNKWVEAKETKTTTTKKETKKH